MTQKDAHRYQNGNELQEHMHKKLIGRGQDKAKIKKKLITSRLKPIRLKFISLKDKTEIKL